MIRDSPARRTILKPSGVGNAAFWIEALDEGGAERAKEEAGKPGLDQFTFGDEGEVRWQDSRDDETVKVALVIGDENTAAALRQLIQTLNACGKSPADRRKRRAAARRNRRLLDIPGETTTPSQTIGAKTTTSKLA